MLRGNALVVLPIVLVAALLLWSLRGTDEPNATTGRTSPVDAPRYTMKAAEWTRLDEQGAPLVTAVADIIDVYDDDSASLRVLEVTTASGDNGVPWKLTAPEGRAPPNERRLQLLGGVVGTGAWPDGEALRFTTPDLWVDPDKHALDTAAGVQFSSAHRNGRSRSLQANWATQQLRMSKDVEIRYEAPRG